MSVVPPEHGGAGSAITNTARQVAVALGVAVLGSILAQAYRARLWPYLSVLPRAARYTATQSIAATQAAALGHHGASLLAAANRAFVASMHVALLISALVATAGAALMAIWLPGRRAAIPASTAAPGPPVAAENPDPADAALVDG